MLRGSKLQPYMLQGSRLTSKPTDEYTPEERVKMGMYGPENSPAKAARSFFQFLDDKLPWGSEAFVIVVMSFLVEGPNHKFKTCQIQK